MIEERELLEKLGRYLHLGRRGLVGYAFLLSTLPVVTMVLAIALNKSNKWYWSIPILILWLIWIFVQGRGIHRRNKVGGEILNMKGAGEK